MRPLIEHLVHGTLSLHSPSLTEPSPVGILEGLVGRSQEHLTHMIKSRPNNVLDLQVKVIQTVDGDPLSLGRGQESSMPSQLQFQFPVYNFGNFHDFDNFDNFQLSMQ